MESNQESQFGKGQLQMHGSSSNLSSDKTGSHENIKIFLENGSTSAVDGMDLHRQFPPPLSPPQPLVLWSSLSSSSDVMQEDEDKEEDQLKPQKRRRPRMVWTQELDKKFVDAVEILGEYNAVPTKILREMGVAGITCANVSTHLQTYRLYQKELMLVNSHPGGSSDPSSEDVPATYILNKKLPARKRDYEDATNNHVKDGPQQKKLRKKPAEKSSDEQKGPLDDPIAETLCQPRFFPTKKTEKLSNIPYKLLVEIAKRLKKLEDFTCFRSVSRSLHLSVEGGYFEGLRFRKSLPYLMLPPDSRDGIRPFYSLVEGESIVASLGIPTFKTSTKMCFESLGWLLTVDVDGSMSLLDPFSNTEIPVPHLHTIPGLVRVFEEKRILIRKMVLSSRPNETSDFILMVLIGDSSHLAFWRLGDKAWNKIHEQKGCFRDVVFGGGEQFYAISSSGIFWAIDLSAGRVECRIIIDHVPGLSAHCRRQGQYILKSIDGSLLGIKRTRDTKFFLTSVFEVYDIDIESGRWKEVDSLGSKAIFIGRNSSIDVDATAPSNGGVIKANHIYFTDDLSEYQNMYFTYDGWRGFACHSRYAKGGSVDSGVFNLETGDIEPIYPVAPLTSNVCPAMWITPNLSF